ncbi:MAG TPA: sulfatase-like hydrolase/transferase [Thermoanaerobaculia bacterium]|jgi:arylsulfatase A-like enzyme/Tfp pilus assembly protein PilF|nr:sulfatase-like hydrolase/transferase [Thermoanaerobaculia bacterium]
MQSPNHRRVSMRRRVARRTADQWGHVGAGRAGQGAPGSSAKKGAKLIAALASLAALAALAVPLAGCRLRAPQPGAAPAAGWNLLLVTLDTMRADHLGCYGRPSADTPALDALAARGVRFDQAQSAVPLTLPSHATILSGLLPPRHGLRDNGRGALPPEVDTLATRLSAAGYRTGAFVGAFVLDHRYGLARGFSNYDDEIPRRGSELEAERPGREVVDRALAWLDEARSAANAGPPAEQKPFFAWVHLYDAHAPYAPPEPFRSRHAGDPYSGEVAAVDAQVDRLTAWLARRDLAKRTVVVVAGDHGEGLGEHGEATHGLLLYQATLRVPLLIAAPGLLAPRVVRAPVGLADVAPTVAALLGQALVAPSTASAAANASAAPTSPVDGRDLSATLLAGKEPPPADLYAESRYPATFGWSPLLALRRGALKYVAATTAQPAGSAELYDLASDPSEAHDRRAERRREAASMVQSLAALDARLAKQSRAAAPAAADAESRARLAALGYAAPSAAPRAGTRDPRSAVGLFRAFEEAQAAARQGRPADVAARLQTLVAADPSNPVFRMTYARALRDQGRFDAALPFYRQAAALAPADPEVWYELATTLQQAGRADEARAALEETLRRDPGRPQAHNALAVALADAGKLAEARQHLQAALAVDARDAQIWNNLGNVERGLGRADEAARAYERAIALDPRYPDPLNGMGALEVSRQRPAAALPWFERAIALAPQQHEARLNRGIALELMGDRAGAATAYRDFLARVAGDREYAAQRRAAEQLLARLAAAG